MKQKNKNKMAKKKYKQKCLICGYKWNSIKPEPKQCPRCKRYDYNKSNRGKI